MRVSEIVKEALAEDAREGSRFDAEGFSNFCPEEAPADVHAAWLIYDDIRSRTRKSDPDGWYDPDKVGKYRRSGPQGMETTAEERAKAREWGVPDELGFPDGWMAALIRDLDRLQARIAELEAQVNHQRVWLEEAARKHDLSAANARIAELEAELKLEQDASRQAMLEVTQRLVATEAERDRLKAVLTKIANQHTEAEREKEGIEEKDCDFVGAWDAVVEDARAALSGEGVTE